jgi:hypothetical protein
MMQVYSLDNQKLKFAQPFHRDKEILNVWSFYLHLYKAEH